MGKTGKQKRGTIDDGLLFIKNAIERRTISRSEVEALANINYPLFSFRCYNDLSMKDCVDPRFFIDFINRLRKLSQLFVSSRWR